ncbi:hypothetical protein ACF0H5_000034 [Mactra antiquata]
MNYLDLDMLNTILGTTEQFDPPDDVVKAPANVPITVYENDTDQSDSPEEDEEEETGNNLASDTSNDEDDLTLPTDVIEDLPSPYSQVKESLKEKIRTRRESEGADEIKNLFEVPKKYKMTVEEEKKIEVRKQRNRIAANKSRLKRIAREKHLEEEAERLERENKSLKKEVASTQKLKNVLKEILHLHLPSCKHSNQSDGRNVLVKTRQGDGLQAQKSEINHNEFHVDNHNSVDCLLLESIRDKNTLKRRLHLDSEVNEKQIKLEPGVNHPKQQERIPTTTLTSIDSDLYTPTSFKTPTFKVLERHDTEALHHGYTKPSDIVPIEASTSVSTNCSQWSTVVNTGQDSAEASSASCYRNAHDVSSTSGLELITGSLNQNDPIDNNHELKTLTHDEIIQTILSVSNIKKTSSDHKGNPAPLNPFTFNEVNGMAQDLLTTSNIIMESSTINTRDERMPTEKEKIEQIKSYLLNGTS